MNNSTLSDNYQLLNFFGLLIGFLTPFAIVLIIKCCKKADSDSDSASVHSSAGSVHVVIQCDGLDAATVNECPIYTYAQLKGDPSTAAASACAVCLGDYKDGQVARLLPECGHVFHRSCIDPWLLIHPTCPVCRQNSTAPLAVAQPAPPVANQ